MRSILLFALAGLSLFTQAVANERDVHYTEAGFFDIHVCNWPDKPPFIMALFSTTKFDDVGQVSVHTPAGELVGNLDLARFRSFKTREGKDKRAFITHFGLPDRLVDGWYKAVITMKDGRRIESMDYVVHAIMPLPAGMQPVADAADVPLPGELRWDPVPGASFYQVFVYDKWDDKLVFKSNVMRDIAIRLPAGILQSGGRYGWRVNARDVHEHILLGDFNHGTTGPEYLFTTR